MLASRAAEFRVVDEFLASSTSEAAALLVEGEPGMGKTTLWLASLDRARELGFRVLSARPAAGESVLAYASLADMLGEVEAEVWADLPEPQRLAIGEVLLQVGQTGRATDQRAVAAGFLSVIRRLAADTPVLVAMDDLQWLDSASMQVLAFAARRLPSRTRLLGTIRSGSNSMNVASQLNLPRPEAVQRMLLAPMSLGGLRTVIAARLGRSFCRPTLVRIHETSGGNPFYALELARALDDDIAIGEMPLPNTLTELVRARTASLDYEVNDALLAAACAAAPTVELVAAAINAPCGRILDLLACAEDTGIVAIDGHRLRFTHPLLAQGIYTSAAPIRRRRMHRRLAQLLEEPELRARHLALAAASGDPSTLRCLDEAAEIARMRGAPTAAAELLDLAVRLGGDTVERRIQLAANYFNAGDAKRARILLEQTIRRPASGPLCAKALCLLAVIDLIDASFADSARWLERALRAAGEEDPALRLQLLVMLSFAQLNMDRRERAAMRHIEEAVAIAARLGDPHLLSQTISMRVMLRFLRDGGLDETGLRRALKLEDRQADTPLLFRPRMHKAMLCAWTGQLERACDKLLDIRECCIERGEENELLVIDFHRVLVAIWRANFTDADLIAEDAMERAQQLGGELPRAVALTMRAAVAVYCGREHAARHDARQALVTFRRCGPNLLTAWPITILGFLEVSLGNYDAALATLEPLLSGLDTQGTEIFVASFLPDALEAMIALRRFAEAEPLIDRLERYGRRLDRTWMLAVGTRCRAMLAAAHGDLGAAALAAQQAMVEHDRLPMPFERGRTQLLLGKLQRRQRHREAAAATLRDALAAFERMGTALWADQARAELARLDIGPRQVGVLTRSEQRVAELAGSGMTNRDVAAALFLSPKTVEAHLASIYRKLDIRSRAELGRHMSRPKK
ncbi:MAG TPA: LuxR family transcriptional regulator [Mycobacterium sp.]|uniref:helix-turn-helix transcriptional regulator n=1 Tax=Mycobacterium sp. TaxID=1785 RepID=UPI002D2AA42C|nr:LuxR family transcriptional regulator [Mycobacterium sp.]HZU45920.1 LuxR family transcriptional regulator [Mycobacterium sp.]